MAPTDVQEVSRVPYTTNVFEKYCFKSKKVTKEIGLKYLAPEYFETQNYSALSNCEAGYQKLS